MYTHTTRGDILFALTLFVLLLKIILFFLSSSRDFKLYSRQLALSSRSPSTKNILYIYIYVTSYVSKLMIRKTDFKATRRIRLLFFSRQRFAPRAPNISPPSGPRYTRILPTSSATPTPLDSDRLSSLASTHP